MALLDDDEIRAQLADFLAEVRATELSGIADPCVGQDDGLVVDSHEAVVLVTMLEERLGCELPGPEDLEIDQETSLDTLAAVIGRYLRSASAA